MANKKKFLEQASKFIGKSQWDKAIKELNKVIELDPGDVRTLLKLGDVYSKQGDRELATLTYKQVADAYGAQGFFLKAVAVHKQILKHDANNLEVHLKLAELYEQLGLASEAQIQYQNVARIHEDSGNAEGSLSVLERLAELDSENVATSIKLAEGYSRAGRMDDAVNAFAKAAEVLKRQNRVDDYIKVAERLVYHDPARIEVVTDLARMYLASGDTKRGLAKLQLSFKAQPRNIEILTLLAQAFEKLGQTQKTIFVYKELAAVHASDGNVAEAQQAQQLILQLDPTDAEAQQALGQSPVPVSSPQTPSPRTVPPATPAPDFPAPNSSPGFPMPSSRPRPRLASDLAAPAFPKTQPPPPPPPDFPAPTFAPNLSPRSAPAPRMAPRSTPQGAPLSDSALAPRSTPRAAPTSQPAMAPSSSEDIRIEDPVTAAPPPPPSANDHERAIQDIITETEVFVRYGLTDKALAHLRRVFDVDPDNVLAYEKMRDIHISLNDPARAAEAVANIMHTYARNGDEASLEVSRAELVRLAPGHPLAHGGLPGAIPGPNDEDLSIDITEDSGVFGLDDFDDATNAEGSALLLAGTVDEPIGDLLEGGGVGDSTDTASTPSPFLDGPSFEGFAPSEQSTDLPGDLDATYGLQQPSIPSDLPLDDSGSETEPTDEYAWPTPESADPFSENVVTEYPGITGPESSPEAPTGELDLEEAPKLATKDADQVLDDEIEEAMFYIENGLLDEARDTLSLVLERVPKHNKARELLCTLDLEASTDDDPTPSEVDLDAAFANLPTDGEASEEEDPEEQYDLGMVMMDTMSFPNAIAAFEKASRSASRMLSAFEMIGHCYRQMGEYSRAIGYYVQALEQGAEGPAACNLNYEIGCTYADADDPHLALEWLEKCALLDPDHRDTRSRIADMISKVGLPPPMDRGIPGPSTRPLSSKKNKISYL